MFTGYSGKPKVEYPRDPKIYVPESVAKDMLAITHAVNKEVAWFGTVKRIGEWEFEILEIFLPHQETSGSTTEAQPEHMNALAIELLDDPRYGEEAYNSLRFWGHSHVNMGVSPSSQDDKTLTELTKIVNEPFIACRTNKRNQAEFDLRYPNGWFFGNTPYTVVATTVIDDRWTALVKERVHDFKHTPPKGSVTPVYDRGPYLYGTGWPEKGGKDAAGGGGGTTGGDLWDDLAFRKPLGKDEGTRPPHFPNWEVDYKTGTVTTPSGQVVDRQAYDKYMPWAIHADGERYVDWQGETRPIADMAPVEYAAAMLDMIDLLQYGNDLAEETTLCEVCDQPVHTDDVKETPNGSSVCEDCYPEALKMEGSLDPDDDTSDGTELSVQYERLLRGET